MAKKEKRFLSKLMFWKNSADDILEENELDKFFKSLFINSGSEKEIVLQLMHDKKIKHFLFYTSIKNIINILKHGICPVRNLHLSGDEEFQVWDYHHRQESINLDFDISSRAHFWKWASDQDINPDDFMVVAIDPQSLSKNSKSDWIFNRAYGMISVVEPIRVEDISWILIRNEQYYHNITQIIKENNLSIALYLSHDGMVRIGEH